MYKIQEASKINQLNYLNSKDNHADDASWGLDSREFWMLNVEAIFDSRPLTNGLLSDSNSVIPLSLSNLLTLKSILVIPPPGIYYCKHWRRVPLNSNEFWSKCRKEDPSTLQCQQKWNTIKRNWKVGDILLIKEAAEGNRWQMSIIVPTSTDKKWLWWKC